MIYGQKLIKNHMDYLNKALDGSRFIQQIVSGCLTIWANL